MVLGLGVVALGAGCNRQTTPPAPPTTTIGTEIDDTVVTTKVKSALISDQEFKGLDIKVETRKGVVLLSGFVDNQTQIDRALDIARAVEGVQNVINELVIKK